MSAVIKTGKKGIYPSLDTFVLFFGQIFFRIFLMRVMPLDEYGKFVIIMSVSDLMGIFICFMDKSFIKFHSAKKDRDYITIVIIWKLLAVFLVFGIIGIFSRPIVGIFNNVFNSNFLFFIPLILFSGIIKSVARLNFESRLEFKNLFIFSSLDMLFVNLAIVTLHIKKSIGVESIFYTIAFSYLLISIIGLVILISKGFGFGGIKLISIKEKFLNMFNFGKYSFGLSASLIFSNQADSLILAMLMTPREVSLYDAAKKIVPAARMVSTTFSKVLFPKISSFNSDDVKSKPVFEKFLKYGLYVGASASVLNLIAAPIYVTMIYGSNFSPAIAAVMLNSLYFLIHPTANISGNTLAALNKPQKDFQTWIISSCLNIIFNLLLIPVFSFYGAVISSLLTIFSASVMNSYKVKKLLHFSWKNILKP